MANGCECVCVCLSERERERESLWVGELDGEKRRGIIQLVLFLSREMKAG